MPARNCTSTHKWCASCQQMLPLDDFHNRGRNHSPISKQGYCKSCKRVKHADYLRRRTWRTKYNTTPARIVALWNNQSGQCAICSDPIDPPFTSSTSTKCSNVDHNHSTGRVRALLCRRCNSGIGMLKEDIGILQKAIDYLKLHNDPKNDTN